MKMKMTLTLILGMILLYSCSATSDGTTPTVVPVEPQDLMSEAISPSAIDLMWTDRSTNETGFKIERKLVGGTFAVAGTTATDIATYSDTGLNPATTYIYRVYSYNVAGKSPVYSNELTLTTNSPTITNGTQFWQNANLNLATYSDGTIIPEVQDLTQWAGLTTGAWCYYNNDATNGATYGKLYNWYAVAGIWNEASKTDESQRKKLAPIGYHVPSESEWTTLTDYLGGDAVAGGKMKATGTSLWNTPNTEATNSSGFTGLPGGARSFSGTFTNFGANGIWWSSSETNTTNASLRGLYYYDGYTNRTSYNKPTGFSVRCLRD